MHVTGKRWGCGAQMRWSAVVLMLGMLVVMALPVGASQLYTDPNGAFQFVVPDDWQQQQPSDSTTVAEFGSADSNAILLLDDQTIAAGTSSLAFYKAATMTLSSTTGYRLNSTSNVLANGAYHPTIDYTVTNRSGVSVRVRQAFIASGTDGWILTVAAVDSVANRYLTTFTNAAQSFTTAPTIAPLPVQPAPMRPAPMQPATLKPTTMQPPAQGAAGGLPVGHYSCLTNFTGNFAGGLTIRPNGAYTADDDPSVGMYRFDAATGQITFPSGPYASGGEYGIYDTTGYPTIQLKFPEYEGSIDCQPGA